MTVYAYIRVSTDLQTVDNQRFEIEKYCKKHEITVSEWISDEGVSGGTDYHKRGIGDVIERCKADDLIICSEISRLGRDLMMIMEMLRRIMDRKCRLYTIKDNFKLGDDIQCKVLAFAFGLAAEIERNLIRQRTKEALARLKAEGKVLGRPKGKRSEKWSKLSPYKSEILEMLEAGELKAAICRRFGCNKTTLLRFLKVEGLSKYIPESVKKLDISEKKLRECAETGMTITACARTLSVDTRTIRNYAEKYAITFGKKMSIYDRLDELKGSIENRLAEGESAQSIRKSLGIPNSTWCTWTHRSGLSRSYNVKDLLDRKKELIMLARSGINAQRIGEIMGFGTGCVCKALDELELSQSKFGVDYELAAANGISRSTVLRRLSLGWSVQEAISKHLYRS